MLAGDDQRSGAVAIFNDFQQIAQALGHSALEMVIVAQPLRCCQLEAMTEERSVATDPSGYEFAAVPATKWRRYLRRFAQHFVLPFMDTDRRSVLPHRRAEIARR